MVIDAAGLVAFRAEHVKAPGIRHLGSLSLNVGLDFGEDAIPRFFVLVGAVDRAEPAVVHLGDGEEFGVASEHHVGSTSCHVGRNGDRTEASGLSHDGGFARMVLRVEDLVLDPLLGKQLREVLALLDAGRADQNRLPHVMSPRNVFDDLLELRRLVLVDEVGLIDANHRPVGRDGHDPELVGAHELGCFGLSGTGHAGEFLVQAEVVLQSDRREGLVLGLDRHALLGLDRLVDALVIATTHQDAAGVLVDDEHLAIHHDVVLVFLE